MYRVTRRRQEGGDNLLQKGSSQRFPILMRLNASVKKLLPGAQQDEGASYQSILTVHFVIYLFGITRGTGG